MMQRVLALVPVVQDSIYSTLIGPVSRSSSSTGTISIRNPYPPHTHDFTPFEMGGTGLETPKFQGQVVHGGF